MRVTSKITDKIKVKASFIAGSSSEFRDSSDARMKSAIRDVVLFLSELQDDIDEPTIHSGTTCNPENIIMLCWLMGEYSTIKLVSVSFQGHNKCNISWDDLDGNNKKKTNVTIDNLIKEDVSGIINSLASRSSNNVYKGPNYS